MSTNRAPLSAGCRVARALAISTGSLVAVAGGFATPGAATANATIQPPTGAVAHKVLIAPKSKKSTKPKISALRVGSVSFSEVTGTEPVLSWGGQPKYYRTIWAFPVTNTSRKFTAVNSRARVVLRDGRGQVALSTIVTLASKLAPGATAWVAPLTPSGYTYYTPKDLDPSQTGVTGIASAKASIVKSRWVKGNAGPLPTIDASINSGVYYDQGWGGYWKDLRDRSMVQVSANGVYQNSRKTTATVYSTWVLRDGAGNPTGGLRFASTRERGSSGIAVRLVLPEATANNIGSVTNYSAWR